MRRFRASPVLRLGVFGIVMIAAACGSKGGTQPNNPPGTMSISSGNNQVGAAGQPLAAPLAVLVKDAQGAPQAGVSVSWAVATGGGSVTAASSSTDATGVATIGRTLGPNAGTQTATATASGFTGSPVTFSAVAQIQGATQIAANGGAAQSDTVLDTLPTPISVIVKDQNGTPVGGVIVTWSVTGGGSVVKAVDTTTAGGISSARRVLGSLAGTPTTVATVTGLIGSPVSISSTATAGNATQVSLSSGNNQTGQVGLALPNPQAVLVGDAYGNPKSGFTVNWVVGSGGGSVSAPSSVSGSNGIAAITRTLGPSAGTQTDTAIASGLTGSPIAFTANAVTAPVTASVTVGPGVSYSPDSVKIASGGKVTWTWAANSLSHNVQWLTGPGTLPASSATQTSGTYQVTFTTAGTYTYNCIVHGNAMTGKVVVVP